MPNHMTITVKAYPDRHITIDHPADKSSEAMAVYVEVLMSAAAVLVEEGGLAGDHTQEAVSQ